MEQIHIPKQDYRVLCLCYTYNQVKYIEDTLNGFAMQKTDFPFACLVVEDCSTDGEQDAIKAWLERECDMSKAEYIDHELSNVILVPHKTNVSCTFAIYLLKRNLWKEPELKETLVKPWREHCEYEALCEGDDYWTSPFKLQKQSDFLDTHEKHSFCTHNYRFYYQDQDKYTEPKRKHSDLDFDTRLYLKYWPTQPLTAMYRSSAYPSKQEIDGYKYFRDNHLFYHLLQKGRGYYFNEIMGVYRKHGGGIYSGIEENKALWIDILAYLEIYKKFSFDKILREKIIRLYANYIIRSNNMAHNKLLVSDIGFYGVVKACLLIYGHYAKHIFVKYESCI